MAESSMNIQKFDGNNFTSWKFRIICISEGKDLDGFIKEYPPKDEKITVQARGIITCAMDVTHKLTMKKEETWEQYLLRAEKLLQEARILGGSIEDEEFITAFIRGLPPKYNLVSMQFDNYPDATISDIRIIFELHEERNKNNEDENAAYNMGHKFNKTLRKIQVILIEKENPNASFVKSLDIKQHCSPINNLEPCITCIQSKFTRLPFKKIDSKQSTKPLDLLHMDLIGPFQHESIGRAIYVLNIVDDFSRKIFPKFLRSKSETFAKLKEFIELIENIKEAMNTYSYIKNRTPHKRNDKTTPEELFTRKKPTIKHLKVFGCRAEYWIPKIKRYKFEKITKSSIFVGYSNKRKAFRICDPKIYEITETRDASFIEKEKGAELLNSTSSEPDKDKNVYNLRPTPEQGFYYESSLSDEDTSQDDTTSDPTYHPADSVMKVDSLPIIPTNYEEAINSPDKEKWVQAMKGEIDSSNNHKVWDVLPMTKTIKPIKSKWVFSIKNSYDPLNPIYKARLVAVGCTQKLGVDYSETYSPVIKSDSLRTLIAFAAMKNLHIHHFDIETAFLYGKLEKTIYMSQPKGFDYQEEGMSPKEIYEDMVDTLREDAPSYSTVKKWVAAFKQRRISTEDEHGPGRPVESVTQENIDKIHDLAMLDRRMTVRQIEETLGIPKTTVDRIMREHLGFRKISARWVPKLLTPDQKAVRRKLSSDNLALFEANPEEFVNRFVTMDETWAHHFTPESKQQSMKIVYHQDNAPSHRSLQAMATIYDSGFELLPHAPYSPDLAPSDFNLFPHLKKSLSGIHFRSDEEVIDAVTSFFESLETSFFLDGIKALEHRWKNFSRSYLFALLEKLGLPSTFLGWISVLYGEADASIRVGDVYTKAFPLLNKNKKLSFNLRRIELTLQTLLPKVQEIIDDSHFKHLTEYIESKCRNRRAGMYNRQSQKLNRWNHNPKNHLKESNVINLSKQQFTQETITLLAKGLNFVPSLKINIPKTIASIETSIKNIPNEEKEKVRTEIVPILKSLNRQNKNNLTQDERNIISSLKANKSIIISPSDKGKNTVIMDTIDYDNKIKQLLEDQNVYELLPSNPLANIIKDPLRPIVSYAGTPIYLLSKYLSSVISPFQKELPHTIPNSTAAIEIISRTQITENSRLVSFDVESLYTSIPHDEAIAKISEFLNAHPNLPLSIPKEALIDLLKLCLSFNYFNYKNQYYKQIKGLPMGNPISSALANIFMNNIDQLIIDNKQLKITFWKRYIDDILCITENNNTISILNFLNNIKPFLTFTHEIEEKNSLSFLDTILTRNSSKIETGIYRKPTHTGGYLNFSSFGPINHKISVIKTLSKRISTHCSNNLEKVQQEKIILMNELQSNSYPTEFIKRQFYRSTFIPPSNSQSHKSYCTLPYSYGIERISRALKKYNIKTIYQTPSNLKTLLRHPDTKHNTNNSKKIQPHLQNPVPILPSYIHRRDRENSRRKNQSTPDSPSKL
ncbi:hypothetical protein LAZ67_10003098 [Cordylochernes scorpioides]|uniref:Reverse transcriptase domain-containing protein n=1 Tax=Cordylochernes scorpioides TaxID=51811 RepID=A0ABY6KX24_9ARAC|nr:hypothetical protein LAZ67_10003098 [Cordylochernes scorpioides]